MINRLLNNSTGVIILSILLGLGFSTLFRRSCKNNCIILKGPEQKKIDSKIFNFDGKCYKYKHSMIKCSKTKK